MVEVKICGISSLADYQICRSAGAHWVGMVYYPGSPRHLDSAALAWLADQIDQLNDDDSDDDGDGDGDSGGDGGPQRVLLSVDQSEASLRQLIAAARPDYLQLHGTESVDFASAMKAAFNLPIIKMIPIATAADMVNCAAWDGIADWLIFDAKTDPGTQPGGTGHSFDWQILPHYSGHTPWMLAGGLTAGTVADAVRISGARAVDVSSGVESARGKKDENKIHAFIQAAQIG